MGAKKGQKDLANMPFEEALEKLENIVRDLEKGETALEQALALFEEGIKLARYCSSRLDEAEGKIEMLLKEGESVQKVPFAGEEGTAV
jgi:exodeoxyribonuclease VII small subunit